MRASTVKQFGGFSQATFCTEELMDETGNVDIADNTRVTQPAIASIFGW
jgi:hypothetical protein